MKDLINSVTVDELEKFKTSTIWKLMEQTLLDRLELTRDDLERAPKKNIEELGSKGELIKIRGVVHLQGAAEEIRYMLALPDILILDKKERRNEDVHQK